MHDEITILDVEEENAMFTVVFEVPGEPYNQSYPKRLRHCFPMKESWFEEVELEGGEKIPRYEQYLLHQYVDAEDDKKEREEVVKKLRKDKDRVRGKKLGRKK